MSEVSTEFEDVAWEDVALRRIFLECLESSTISASISSFSSFSSLPSTSSEVSVDTLINYIRDNASANYRNKALLDELQKSIEEVSSNGQVNWTLFKKASRQWIAKVLRHRQQDSNNNVAKDDSHDGSVGRSDDEKPVTGDGDDNDRGTGDLGKRCRKKPKTPRRFVTADFVNLSNVSRYSPSSDTTQTCPMSDTTPESADEMDLGAGCGDVAKVDLRLRVRRFDEENASLREELVRAEELTTALQRQCENLRRKFDQTDEKCRQLERENDEFKEILADAKERERDCRWALQKVEKERGLLARKLEGADAETHQIIGLTSKLEKLKKEKLECIREATACRQALESKQNECEMLREKLAQIEEANDTLSKSYEKTIRHLREKNDELKSQIFDLQIQHSVESPSDVVCSTPPTSYLHSYMQSTPFSNRKDLKLQDSLYTELKASGFSVTDAANETRLRDLEDELTWYNEEIRDAVKQIDNILDRVDRQRRTPHVPDLSLDESTNVKTADIYALLQKLSQLSNTVNEIIWKPKVKDASFQVYAFSAETDKRICSRYGIPSFEDGLRFVRENPVSETANGNASVNEEGRKIDVFVEAFATNSRLLGEYVKEAEVTVETNNYRETEIFSPTGKGSMTAPFGVQERTIIDPIVEELDRILQCANNYEESPSKNPRYKCIYTCAKPSTDLIALDKSSPVSAPNLPKRLERELASTFVISSAGDAPPPGMTDHSSASGDETRDRSDLMDKIISHDDTSTFDGISVSESMLDSDNLDCAKASENKTLAEELIDSKLEDTNFGSSNPSQLSQSSTFAEPSTPVETLFVIGRDESQNDAAYRSTPNKNFRNLSKRKISVFHRSFDVDTLHSGDAGGGPDTYRLTERSMSTPTNSVREKRVEESMELDLECMRKTPNTRNLLLDTYRTNDGDSDSSQSLSPVKSPGIHEDSPMANNMSHGEVPSRSRARPIILAPTKLKLPLLKEIPAYADADGMTEKNMKVYGNEEIIKTVDATKDDVKFDTDVTVNDTQRTYDLSNIEEPERDSVSREASSVGEMIRPGDEIERGITYRRRSFSRESDLSAYSLLSPAEESRTDEKRDESRVESASTVIVSDGESTSCDSSPRREAPVAQSTAKLSLVSTYEKPADRAYTRHDPSRSRGSWSVDRLEAAGYQTRNDSIVTSGVGSYDSGGGSGGVHSSVEKASVVPAVALAMSSGEDTSDSECGPMGIRADQEHRNIADETRSVSPTVLPFTDGAVLGSSTPAAMPTARSEFANPRGNFGPRNPMAQKRDKRERPHAIRRSLSESGCGRSECSCRCCNTGSSATAEANREETRPNAFPGLTDARLQESGIANLSSTDELEVIMPHVGTIGRLLVSRREALSTLDSSLLSSVPLSSAGERSEYANRGNLTEAELEKKYTAVSIGLVTDRLTLPRRVALSIRQRDQSEINLAAEVQKMQQDIQDLAPLCIDRESLERVERVRHQLEMINQCAHRVSCTAETLGAVHQEHRVSRAVLLADRYLLVLRSRCDKLTSDLAETKRILTENNIVIEESNGEFGEDMPRIRYRGMPTNNRTMMARRRASIATIFRPLGNFQDIAKDGVRQRNSVSGRVTLRRPSLSAESQKWEADKLDRTDSSSSIGELREIFEQAESRRGSREENNNALRLHSSNFNVRDCENGDGDVPTNPREESVAELPAIVDGCRETILGRRTPLPNWSTSNNHVPWRLMFWCIVISFVLGFYMKHVVSSVNGCSPAPYKWWSIEEILGRYVNVKNDSPRPI